MFSVEPLKVDREMSSIEDVVDSLSITSATGLRRPTLRTAAKRNKKKKGELRQPLFFMKLKINKLCSLMNYEFLNFGIVRLNETSFK